MNIYYTVSSNTNEQQTNPHLSLGRFKSGTIPKNDDFSNLFDEVSLLTAQNPKDEYIALMVKNDLPIDVENVNIWVDNTNNTYSKIYLAGVETTVDSDGNSVMEQTRDRFSRPFYADFDEYIAHETPLVVGNVVSGGVFGLWVKRELLVDLIKQDQCDVYEQDPTNERRVVAKEKETEDVFILNINWD